jgi:predicted  nucleic acid-binding Zn-ribbon protein
MLEAIEKLLALQERDRRILRIQDELAHIPQERQQIQGRYDQTRRELDQARLLVQKTESDRKRLELEVEAKRQLIERYALQQFQTKKNEEYRALAKEIETCKADITRIEDQELTLMEQGELAERTVRHTKSTEAEANKTSHSRMADLAAREEALKAELRDLESKRSDLVLAVEDKLRRQYERILVRRGGSVVVGIQHGVCGGCHMQLSRQIVVSCQADQELMSCPNCGRMLYYTPDMDLATAD